MKHSFEGTVDLKRNKSVHRYLKMLFSLFGYVSEKSHIKSFPTRFFSFHVSGLGEEIWLIWFSNATLKTIRYQQNLRRSTRQMSALVTSKISARSVRIRRSIADDGSLIQHFLPRTVNVYIFQRIGLLTPIDRSKQQSAGHLVATCFPREIINDVCFLE
jgi:hypothetical protein